LTTLSSSEKFPGQLNSVKRHMFVTVITVNKLMDHICLNN
jgi:hypothetical protein